MDDTGLLTALNNLARAYTDTGNLDAALPLHEEAIELTRDAGGDRLAVLERSIGPGHASTREARKRLAALYERTERREEAAALREGR